jgi:hypothetical protein
MDVLYKTLSGLKDAQGTVKAPSWQAFMRTQLKAQWTTLEGRLAFLKAHHPPVRPMPLVIDEQRCYLPLQSHRLPEVTFINVHAVVGCYTKGYQTLLVFQDGHEVTVDIAASSLRLKLKKTRMWLASLDALRQNRFHLEKG